MHIILTLCIIPGLESNVVISDVSLYPKFTVCHGLGVCSGYITLSWPASHNRGACCRVPCMLARLLTVGVSV